MISALMTIDDVVDIFDDAVAMIWLM